MEVEKYIKFNTGCPYEMAKSKSAELAKLISNTRITKSIRGGIVYQNSDDTVLSEPDFDSIENKLAHFPVVVQLVATGRSGKDTFATMVHDCKWCYGSETTSVIYPAVKACDTVVNMMYQAFENYYDVEDNPIARMMSDRADKSEVYRQFLHDVKDAFTKSYNIPLLFVMERYMDLTRQNITHKYPGLPYGILFVNNRDLDTCTTVTEGCWQMGIQCVTLKSVGQHDVSEYVNSCDSNVDEIPYDILIDNSGTIDSLREKASIFSQLFEYAYRLTAIPIPRDITFQTLIEGA